MKINSGANTLQPHSTLSTPDAVCVISALPLERREHNWLLGLAPQLTVETSTRFAKLTQRRGKNHSLIFTDLKFTLAQHSLPQALPIYTTFPVSKHKCAARAEHVTEKPSNAVACLWLINDVCCDDAVKRLRRPRFDGIPV